MKVAITEDNVYYAGSNGETIHNQAFRKMYPTTSGIELNFVTGNYLFMIDCPLLGWEYNNLRVTVYLQDADSWEIIQSASAFLNEIEYDPTAVNDLPGVLQVRGAVPNPFNPSTEICFSIAEDSFVEVTIYDSSGKVVREIDGQEMNAGENSIPWDGKNNNGVVLASGVYYARVSAGIMAQTTKLVLAK
ncbi:MAG: T9SS type A sorting domain-containing protein [bacterium]|nr:T9SS type A sorting domain-containing protein [bacterium]